jgi:hydrogenase maturation protein HypF
MIGSEAPPSRPRERLRLAVRGVVQGVGFRPFVHRLACELTLDGWVCNDASGAVIEVEGPPGAVRAFLTRLPAELPPHAAVTVLEPTFLGPAGLTGFVIRPSLGGEKTAAILPDIAVCAECLREMRDPKDRRYRYPFTNCTHCGPRYSIVESLPYDRPRTTMKAFRMCAACRAEYEDPRDRRFHAQPIACPDCGPQAALLDRDGNVLARRDEAVLRAARALAEGRVLAVKGIGGFQLWADARDTAAVLALRGRKRRRDKPFALMVPTLAAAEELCEVSALEQRLLASAEAPIVLLRRRRGARVSDEVAPGNPTLGLMLPHAPLHHLLLEAFPFPVVATSGNLSEEPIVTDELRAREDLGGIADLFLVHDRPIARPVDDSIVAVVEGRETVLRRARGYAPLPLAAKEDLPHVLAVGGHLKGAVAVARGRQVFVSQHLGDLSTERGFSAFEDAIRSLSGLYDFAPEAVVCDLHPGYASTAYARALGVPVVAVQHHHAHVLSCLADNGVEPPALGVAWDGSGWGTDGTIWGGEFLRATPGGFERTAHFLTFPLPGGEAAVREPRRAALGLLYALAGPEALTWEHLAPVAAFTPAQRQVLGTMLDRGLSSPRTSSVGRLFDAVAALAGLHQETSFEGQAAMAVEHAAEGGAGEPYPFSLSAEGSVTIVDWEPMLRALLEDVRRGTSAADVCARFHDGLVSAIVAVARRAGETRVALTGGCFQNRLLLTRSIRRLRAAGFEPLRHRRVPPNDGGLALGQIAAAARVLKGAAPCA